MRVLSGLEASPRTVIKKKVAEAKRVEMTDYRRRTLAAIAVVLVCVLVLGSLISSWTGREESQEAHESAHAVPRTVATVDTSPRILTLLASKSHETLERFKSPLHDMV
jgi:flagellar basal body-associated protein FliL